MPKLVESPTRQGADSSAPSVSPDLTALLTMLSEQVAAQTAQMATLAAKVETIESRPQVGQMRPMDPQLSPALGLGRTYKARPGNGAGVGDLEWMAHGADSHPIGPGYPRPRFRPGDLVRIIPDVHHGTGKAVKKRIKEEDGSSAVDDEGRPVFERTITYLNWGQVLKKIGFVRCPRVEGQPACPELIAVNTHCSYCRHGPEIMSVEFMHEDGQWAFRVRVPGLTGPYGEVMVDAEIEPA